MAINKRNWIFGTLIFLGGLLLGMVFFFPLQKLQSSIVAMASKATGMEIQISELKFSSGLGLGLAKGSLLALRAHNLSVTNPAGKNLTCDEAVVAPHLWTFLIGRIQVGIWCDLDAKGASKRDLGALTLLLKLSPFWKPSKLGVDASFDSLNLEKLIEFGIPRGQIKVDAVGRVSGDFSMTGMALGPEPGEAPRIDMNIKAEELALNQIELGGAPAFPVPLNFGKMEIKGNTDGPKIVLNPIRFKSTELQGQMELDLSIGAHGMLQNMVWKGSIKTVQENPDRELASLLNSNFGPVDSTGFRDFVKRVEGGNLQALLGPPTE